MTFGSFVNLIRQYAVAAQRKRRSYAAQVNHLAALYADGVEERGLPAEEAQQEKERAWGVIEREYARNDAAWERPAAG
jgi:hypothetical protein